MSISIVLLFLVAILAFAGARLRRTSPVTKPGIIRKRAGMAAITLAASTLFLWIIWVIVMVLTIPARDY